MFNYISPPQIVLQEVPSEISLLFTITGCRLNCLGCHSPEIQNAKFGTPLSSEIFTQWIDKYQALISCVVFFGGEWQSKRLIELLKISQGYKLKTCLYTGKDKVNQAIMTHLDYLKLGPWVESLGGLDSSNTNQRMFNVKTGELLNVRFLR